MKNLFFCIFFSHKILSLHRKLGLIEEIISSKQSKWILRSRRGRKCYRNFWFAFTYSIFAQKKWIFNSSDAAFLHGYLYALEMIIPWVLSISNGEIDIFLCQIMPALVYFLQCSITFVCELIKIVCNIFIHKLMILF